MMKDLLISYYNLEILDKEVVDLPYKDFLISQYAIEVLDKEVVDLPYKDLFIASFNIEIISKYIPESTRVFYAFNGEVKESTDYVERQVLLYDQISLLPINECTSVSGTFYLTAENKKSFLMCKDDVLGESYNYLIIADMQPFLVETYGMIESNPGISAKDIKDKNPIANFDGIYWIKPSGYIQAVQVYCDMTTQGGGWTLCARWDRDFPSGIRCLSLGALRNLINQQDLIYTNTPCSSQCSTLNIIPMISDGARLFMHVSLDINDTHWKFIYFSEIYQCILDNPDNIFNPDLDTNYTVSAGGTIVRTSVNIKNRWFDYQFNYPLLSRNAGSQDYYLSSGPGLAMFTVGGNYGAAYCSHNETDCRDPRSPRVLWGFYGKDGSLLNSGTTGPLVGTNCSATTKAYCRFNLMFIR